MNTFTPAPELSRTTPAMRLAVACCAGETPGSSGANITMLKPQITFVRAIAFILSGRNP